MREAAAQKAPIAASVLAFAEIHATPPLDQDDDLGIHERLPGKLRQGGP